MKRTMQFSVGGQTVDVPADEIGQFSEAAKMTGASPTPMRRFRIGGQEIDVPEGELDQFVEAAKVTGSSPEEVRTFQMADGSSRSFTGAESAAFLRSPEYRSSADYVPPEQGSPTWASIKGAASGAAEGAWEGGKAGLAKAAWALPQVGTGVLRAAGNVANLGGNAKNAVGDALVGVADAADAKMEEVFPTSTAARLGYEDWGTKTGDFFGNVAGMAVKFAPAMGAGVASRGATIFAESMFASDGINAYARTFDQAKENGADDVSANALGAMSGLVNYFGGKALLKAGGVGAKIQNPILRELAAAGMSGGVMGAQGGANRAIENVATGKPVGEGVAGAVAEGVAEGAAFHGANMIPRLPKFVKQTKEHFTAARNWIMDAAKDDPQMLSELMDQPAMDEVIKARRSGADVSRRMGEDVFLPNNMSGEQRNAVIDSIIAYRDGLKARDELAKANRAAEAEAGRAADEEALTRKFKDSAERQNARQNAEALKMAREGAEETASEQPTNVNAGRGENAELLQQSADQYATMDSDGKAAYSAWRKANGKADTEANRLDWFQNEYVAKRSRLSERATENEIPELTREEYEAQLKEWEARKAVARKQGKKFDEPKPVEPVVADEPKPVAKTQTSADDGFRAWAVGRDGKPMEFATPADEARSREVYEMLVKSGKVDPETGRTIVPTAPEVSEKAPEQAPVAEPAQKTEVKRIENPKAGGRKTAKKAEAKAENAGVVAAQKILKEKFYQDEKTLAKALAALPEQAPKELRGAYETAIAEAKRRAAEKSAETPASDDSAKTPSDVSSPKGNAFRVGNGITAEVSKAGDGKFVVELNEKYGGAYPNARFDTEAQAADYARKCGELVDSGKFNLISAIMEVDKSLPDEFIPNRARLTAAKPDGKGRMVKAKREQKKLEAISKKMNESAKIFNAEFKKFAEDFGLEEFDKKVNRRDYGHVGEFDETAALDHMRKFDIDTLRDLKTRAVKFNLGHYNGRDEKIKEWFDKVIAEKESAKKAPQTPSAASATKKAEPAAPTAAKPAQPVQPPKAETPAEFKARISDDPVLKRIDAEFRKAKTDAERNALQERFRARVDELRSVPAPTSSNTEHPVQRVADGKGGMKSESNAVEKPKKEISTDEGASRIIEWLEATPDERANMNIESVVNALPNGTDIYKIVSNKMVETRGKKDSFGRPTDGMKSGEEKMINELVRYKEEMDGRRFESSNEGVIRPRQKQNGEGKRLNAEREAILADIDDAMKFYVDGSEKKGEVDSYLKMIEEANEKGDARYAKAITGLLDKKLETISFGKDGLTIKVPNSNATYSVRNASQLRRLRELVEKHYGKEASKKYYDISDADRLESMRSDAKVIAWAEKNGLGEIVDGKVSPRAVVDYLRNQVEMAKRATKRLFADANVEVKDRDWNAEIDGNDGLLKDKSGRVVGTFNPATKKVTLYRGADAKTVYHELIGHGVEDWARRNDKALHGKLMDLAKTAPKEIVDDVRSRYPDADEATIAKEVIARIAEGKGLENIRLREAPKAWYAKAYVAVRDAILGFMEKIGLNRVDLSKIESMTPAEAMDHLMKEVAGGKTLGEIGASGADAKVGRLEKWANAFYDRHTSLAKLSKDAAEAKSLQPGREAAFEALVFKPKKDAFAEILKRNDITAYEVDEYMKAVAAPERNAADGFESSGMSDELAARTRKHYEGSSRFDGIKEAADFLWKMQEEGMLERIRAGLVGKDEYAEWKAREKHHVPFRSAVDENGDHIPWTRGVSGPEFVQHEGRYSESGSPSAWMFQEFANAHLRAIENDSRIVLKNAVESDPSIGRIETNPEIREQRAKGGEGSPNVVSFKTVGKDGRAVTHHIVLEGERGSAAASSYTNRDLMNKSPLLKKTQAFMRFWASTATEWSPTFALRNTFADNIDLASVVLVEKGAKEGRRWIADYAKNRSGLRREMWKFAREGKVESGSVLERFIRNGGLIGGFQREGYADLNEQFGPKRIARDFAAGRNRANAVRRYTLDLVKAVNSYAELMTRVAAFKTNVDAGMDAKDAALWSRRISVDFNRKGNVTPITNTLFMFSNSTIGATMRQIEAMGKGWKTPEGRRALAGLAAFGVAEAAIEHFFNQSVDEENERKGDATGKDVNEHTRKTSLYFRYGNRVFRAPVHEDPLMKLVYVANATTRYALGDMTKEDYAKEVAGGVIEDVPRFFGQGSKTLEAGWNTWMPTALQPFVQALENKDYAGRPIYRPKYDEAMPDSQNGRKSTQAEYKWAAEYLNSATGGNRGRSGWLDVTPETVKLISESLGKNLGRDLGNAADVGWNILSGNIGNLDSRRTPVVRDLMRTTDGNDNRYFDAVRRYDADRMELKRMRESWTPEERRAFVSDHPWVRAAAGKTPAVQRLQTEINKLRRMEGGEYRTKDGTWRKAEWTEERVETFKERRRELQARVLKIMGE